MPKIRRKARALRALLAGPAAASALVAFAPGEASAHFVLEAPASWRTQDEFGSPQKAPPCGNEGGGTDTLLVTPFRAGETITITIDETVYHPGHYRVALALNDQGGLPDPPEVTPGEKHACGTAEIQSPPAFPVLADGVLVHEAPFNGPQSFQVTLPADVTCEKCTLQIIEFMSEHGLNNPGGCFYHHCANISISDGAAGSAGSAGSAGGGGAGGGGGQPGGGGASGASGGPGAGGQPNTGATGGAPSAGGSSGGKGGGTGGSAPADGSSDDDGCAAAAPRGAPAGLAALAGLFATAALLRRRRR